MLEGILSRVKFIALVSSFCVSLLGSSFIFTATPARAGEFCIDVWNDDCDVIPDDVMPEVIPGRDFFDVYVYNRSNQTIWVAVHYLHDGKQGYRASCSTPDGGGEDCMAGEEPTQWMTDGYWQIEPGQKLFVLDGNLPAKASDDALHIAVATVYAIDYLLTWNCKHIANAQIQKKLACEFVL